MSEQSQPSRQSEQIERSEQTEQLEQEQGPEQEARTGPGEPAAFRLRRAPRYRPFGVTGAVLGAAGGIVLALSFTAASDYSMRTIAGYFAAIFGLVGALVGLGLAVLLERRRS